MSHAHHLGNNGTLEAQVPRCQPRASHAKKPFWGGQSQVCCVDSFLHTLPASHPTITQDRGEQGQSEEWVSGQKVLVRPVSHSAFYQGHSSGLEQEVTPRGRSQTGVIQICPPTFPGLTGSRRDLRRCPFSQSAWPQAYILTSLELERSWSQGLIDWNTTAINPSLPTQGGGQRCLNPSLKDPGSCQKYVGAFGAVGKQEMPGRKDSKFYDSFWVFISMIWTLRSSDKLPFLSFLEIPRSRLYLLRGWLFQQTLFDLHAQHHVSNKQTNKNLSHAWTLLGFFPVETGPGLVGYNCRFTGTGYK